MQPNKSSRNVYSFCKENLCCSKKYLNLNTSYLQIDIKNFNYLFFISTFLLLLLCPYLCWWIISPQGYHLCPYLCWWIISPQGYHLCPYLCWWIISPQGYHLPSSSLCFGTDMFCFFNLVS